MAKRLPVPAELEYLIEKREKESDRRTGERRTGTNARRAASDGNLERRRNVDRRKKRRRKADSK